MTVYLKRSDSTVDNLIRLTFPEYKGTKVQAIISDSVRFYGTQWDEGNRRTYAIVRLADNKVMPIAEAPFMQNSEFHNAQQSIPDGFVIVVKVDCRCPHIEIITPAKNITAALPAPVELSEDERIVLIATRSLKSSYAGISNYRFHSAGRGMGIERWELAKASLVSKGYLNKAGAITVDGRNVAGETQLREVYA